MSDSAKKILLVDDDVDFLEANRVALEAAGFEVLTATDSRKGVDLAVSEHPSLVVMDLMIEQLYAGFSAVESLHAHEETANIPIIMVSGVTTETGFRIDQGGSKPEWLKVVDYVNKPVDPVVLAKKIAATLGAQK
jgi:DNA-binding response OmpR family regulator